jgi:Xaa-Pro aminopeptidase
VKEQAEVEKIARAAQITDQALANLLVRLKVGTTEFEAAAELEYQMRLLGADGASFPTIIASGPNSALPHAQPGQRRLQTGDLVVIDCGAKWHGYCADLTRTVLVGQEPTARQLEVYRLVQAAQRAGLAAVRGGADCREVDQAARSVIAAAGFGHAFGHGLGHGVGLEIHEQPRLSPRGEGKLAKGMTVTVEPGVYLPPCGGVRIEDLVLVEEQGAKLLSGSDRELFCVG